MAYVSGVKVNPRHRAEVAEVMQQVDNLIGTRRASWDRQLCAARAQLADAEGQLHKYRTEAEVHRNENSELVRRLDLVARASQQLSEKYEARIRKQDEELSRVRMANTTRAVTKSPALSPYSYSNAADFLPASYSSNGTPSATRDYQSARRGLKIATGPKAAGGGDSTVNQLEAKLELETAYAMVTERDRTITALKQAARDALAVNESAVAESHALMALLQQGGVADMNQPLLPSSQIHTPEMIPSDNKLVANGYSDHRSVISRETGSTQREKKTSKVPLKSMI